MPVIGDTSKLTAIRLHEIAGVTGRAMIKIINDNFRITFQDKILS
jgi:hypothetical protein